MSNVEIIVLAIVAVVVIAGIAIWATQRRRSSELRRRFGPEYERTVEGARDKREAEKDLRARQERVDALEIRPLEPAARDRYAERWREVQAMFVDDPPSAVDQADTLIGEVMRARGYPVGDFEQRAADISVNHPQVVDHYRTAHSIAVRRRSGEGATEQLRQAFVHYRALFADLLETQEQHDQEAAPAGANGQRASVREPEAAADGAAAAAHDEAAAVPVGEEKAPSADTPPRVSEPPPAAATGPATTTPTPTSERTTATTAESEQPADPARRA